MIRGSYGGMRARISDNEGKGGVGGWNAYTLCLFQMIFKLVTSAVNHTEMHD